MLEGMGMEPACGRALRAVVLRGQSPANLITSPTGESARASLKKFSLSSRTNSAISHNSITERI
jgi:hypothetical protein